MKGKAIVGNDSNIGSSCASTSKDHVSSKDRERNALFHISIITKQTNIDTIIDSGSQANLISEEVVKQLGFVVRRKHTVNRNLLDYCFPSRKSVALGASKEPGAVT